MHLGALVIAIMRGTAVVDHAQRTVFKLHHDDCGVYVAILLIACARQRCAVGRDLGDLTACQIADHIEIVDGHVQEDAAGDLDIVHGLVIGVA